MTTQHTPNRVNVGLPGAGRFAPGSLNEAPGLNLAPATIFSAADEDVHGAEMTAKLQALPATDVPTRIRASTTTDILREACEDHWADAGYVADPLAARQGFCDALGNLSEERTADHLDIVSFAVAQEMKHLGNREHILSVEHDWEILIDTADYRTDDDLVDHGNEENRAAWEALADTATAAALIENANAALKLTA